MTAVGKILIFFVLLLSVLVTTVSSLVIRYRRGHGLTRLQLRWLLVGAGSVPTLLAAGWVAEALGASVAVAYTGFMVALLVVLTATVAIAILRHDLLDLDRLLSSSASWALTSVISAAVFLLVVVGVAELGTVSDATRRVARDRDGSGIRHCPAAAAGAPPRGPAGGPCAGP